MRTIKLMAATATVTATVALLAACSSSDQPAAGGGATTAAQTTTTTAPAPTSAAMSDGMTSKSDVFGSACAGVPTSGEGSLDGMADDPVATAASNNPLLTTLVAAVRQAGLVDTLNGQQGITVFAPADPAFAKVPKADLDALLADKATLTKVLTYHVVAQRYDKAGILAAKSLPTLQGGTVAVGGSGDSVTVNGASVLCGNIPTANATVFVIDTVLMPTG